MSLNGRNMSCASYTEKFRAKESPRPDNNKIIGRGNRVPTIGNIIAYSKYQTTKQINELKNTPDEFF